MTQEDKELLLKDLCARLPYGVKGIITYNGDENIFTVKGVFNILFLSDTECCHPEDFKPYLRPMSSMTEEEKELLKQEHLEDEKLYAKAIKGDGSMRGKVITHFAADWCNKNHFDYRGLIEKGLALEAPEGMYKTE